MSLVFLDLASRFPGTAVYRDDTRRGKTNCLSYVSTYILGLLYGIFRFGPNLKPFILLPLLLVKAIQEGLEAERGGEG